MNNPSRSFLQVGRAQTSWKPQRMLIISKIWITYMMVRRARFLLSIRVLKTVSVHEDASKIPNHADNQEIPIGTIPGNPSDTSGSSPPTEGILLADHRQHYSGDIPPDDLGWCKNPRSHLACCQMKNLVEGVQEMVCNWYRSLYSSCLNFKGHWACCESELLPLEDQLIHITRPNVNTCEPPQPPETKPAKPKKPIDIPERQPEPIEQPQSNPKNPAGFCKPRKVDVLPRL